MAAALTLLALLLEIMIGYPDRLARMIGHPVTWMGALIGALDRGLNHDTATPAARRLAGMITVLILVVAVGTIAFMLERGLSWLPFGSVAAALLASTLLAHRSLHEHVARVATALETAGLAAGRAAVSHIVGRDAEPLDQAGVARAAIESLAENFSDGVVAPAFWMAIGGPACAPTYKAVNTADSMIGFRTPRHAAFGWAAARLDDLVNLPASRLAGPFIIPAGGPHKSASPAGAWRAVRRDAPRHRSPNAGYPEAAMAGALGLMLAGPRRYGGVRIGDATMGGGRWSGNAADIR